MLSTRDRVLEAFAQHPGKALSGAQLAQNLGMSRASVWKHVRALKAAGLPVRSLGRDGYQFQNGFDLSLFLLKLKKGPYRLPHPWTLHYEIASPSTQQRARQAAELSIPEKHLWVAEIQTQGRGRLDRAWESGAGGLWVSLLLRPKLAPVQIPALTLVAALTMARVVESTCDCAVYLKWPNDLVIQREGKGSSKNWRKLAGILTEMTGETDRVRWVILGIGLNVHNRLSPALQKIGISLAALTKGAADEPIARAGILSEFLSDFDRATQQLEKSSFEPFRRAYWKRYSRPNESVLLQTARGRVRGIARGVDGQGALVVESHNQMHSLSEGEIVL